MDWKSRNKQFEEAVVQYGWDTVFQKLTPLDGAITYLGSQNSKRYDICPDAKCSEHQLWKGKGNFILFKDVQESGAGYCYKCQKRFSKYDLLSEFNNWDFPTAKKEVSELIGFTYDPNHKPAPRTTKPVQQGPTQFELDQAKKRRNSMNKVWSESLYLNDERALPVAKYFAKRGIASLKTLMKGSVRFHPGLPFYIPIPHPSEDRTEEDRVEREKLVTYCSNHPSFLKFYKKNGAPTTAHMGLHPCIVLLVTSPTGEARRIHRIFIDEHGNKASFHKAGFEVKKMMPGGYGLEINGASVVIDKPSRIVALGEGLETVLAVKQVTDLPMECTINAGNLGNYVVKDGTDYVFVFEDLDASRTGEIVAHELEERLVSQGIKVVRFQPPIPLGDRKSVDWLDVLNELGPQGFPKLAISWRELL